MPTFPSGFSPQLTPTFSFAVRLGAGPSAPASGLKVLLIASKTSSGTADDNVSTEVYDVNDAEARFGSRSRMAALVRAFRAIAPRGALNACPVPAAVDGVAATATLAFSGPSTAAGVVRLRIAGILVREIVIPSGTSAATAAGLVQAALATISELPCTGVVGSGGSTHILTLTAAVVGQVGNQLRVVFECTATGITISLNGVTTAVRGKGYFGAGTATAGVGTADLTVGLGAVAGTRYDRIVVDVDDDTNRAAVAAHLVSQSGINTGRRCMGVVGSLEETLATAQGDATALNEPRLTIVYNRRSHQTTGELAAAYVAAKVYGDGNLPGEVTYRAAKANGLSLYPAILATDEEERLTPTLSEALLQSGVSPLGADNLHPGYACVVRPVTTRTKNAQGGRSYLVTDTSKVAVADLVADRCETFASANYADKNLVPDPATIEQAPSSEYVTWPAAIRDDILAILQQMEDEALLINVAANAAAVTVEALTQDGTQYVVCKVPVSVIPHLHSAVGEVQQIA